MDEVSHGAMCCSAERCEPLSNGRDELAAVFYKAGECDPMQVGVALDTGLDVAHDLGVDLVEQHGEGTKHPEVTVDVRSQCTEPADDVSAVSDREFTGTDKGADVA